MKRLKPVSHKAKFEKMISKKIDGMFFDKIFSPVFEVLKELPKAAQKRNAGPQDALLTAIHDGIISYENGLFFGSFNSKTSAALKALGATWSATKKAYALPADKIPAAVRVEISKARSIAVSTAAKIEKILAEAEERYEQMDFAKEAGATIDDLQAQIHKTTEKDVEIPLAFAGYVGAKLKEEYSDNLNLHIKEWYDDEIVRLRKQVQQNVTKGFRASEMVKSIQAEYGVSQRKAEFLSRNETMLLTSNYKQAVYEEAGLKRYQWSTSGDRSVRDTHKAMSGMICRFDDPTVYWNGREWVKRRNIGGVELHPGRDYQCLPADSNVEVAYGIKKAFRRWHTGKMTTIVTQSGKTLRATPNHQVLTLGGWKNIGLIDDSDYVVELTDELIKSLGDNIDNGKTTIGKIFDALAHDLPVLPTESTKEHFHGDSTDSNVDIIDTDRVLLNGRKAGHRQSMKEFFLPLANSARFGVCNFLQNFRRSLFGNGSPFCVGRLGNKLPLSISRPFESDKVCLRPSTDPDASIQQSPTDNSARDAVLFSYGVLALSGDVGSHDHFGIDREPVGRFASSPSVGIHGLVPKMPGEIVSCKADDLGSLLEGHALIKKTDRVVKVLTEDFAGHVFNLETVNNWFTSNGIIIHNCRCIAIPLLEEREI